MYKSDYSYVVAFWAMTDPQMVAVLTSFEKRGRFI